MVDPFTIIGTTAAILDLAHFAGKVINIAQSLYDSTSGSTTENAEINDITVKMTQLLDDLQTQAPSPPRSSQEENVAGLIALCRSIGEKIIALLKKTKAKTTHSLRECIRATMVTVWTKGVVSELQKELGLCMSHLNLHIMTIMRSESGKRFQDILDANMSCARELSSLRELFQTLKNGQKLEVESLGQLRDIFIPPKPLLQVINEERILKSLKFQDMESRFEEVSKNASNTFQWCLQDIELPSSHPDLKISFRDWLTRGQGLYHISGKPGCGKTTLMKFITTHSETERQLKEWAGIRTLVVANFFFWKPGRRLQKNLEGLIRSLVHTILSKLPNLISTVFPQFWDSTMASPWQSQTNPEIHYEDVFSAFEKLTKSKDAMKDLCFCIFIDGLDEFDDPEERHTMLAERLKTWTDLNPENVKICASSREESSFMNQFSPSQRLRLHLLTEADIRTMVESSLGKHPRFRKEASESRKKLIQELISKTEGVFLWAKLVLNELWDGLDDGQTLPDLHDTLNKLPDELGDFYRCILRSTPKSKRQEAWAIFGLVMAMNKFYNGSRLSLFHYSFVEKFFKNPRFAIEQDMRDTTVPEITTRVDAFRSRLDRLCRCLVEVHEFGKAGEQSSYEIGIVEDSCFFAFKDSIRFIHRSVYEFLSEELPEEMRLLKSLDVKAIAIHCLLAQVKLVPWNGYVKYQMSRHLSACFDLLRESNLEHEHLELMGLLDDALLQRQHGFSTATRFNWSRFQSFNKPWVFIGQYNDLTSLLAFSCYAGFQEYVIWSLENRASLSSDRKTRAELLYAISGTPRLSSDSSDALSSVMVLRYLLNRGFNPNFETKKRKRFSVWENQVLNLLRWKAHDALWEAIKVYLEHDVDPYFLFSLKQRKSEDYFVSIDVKIRRGSDFKEITEKSYGFDDTKLFPLFHAAGSKISLRDIVEYLQPHNMAEILSMIDRNLARHKERSNLTLSLGSTSLVEQVDTSSCKPDERLITAQDSNSKLWLKVDTLWRTLQTWTTLILSFVLGTLLAATPRVAKHQ